MKIPQIPGPEKSGGKSIVPDHISTAKSFHRSHFFFSTVHRKCSMSGNHWFLTRHPNILAIYYDFPSTVDTKRSDTIHRRRTRIHLRVVCSTRRRRNPCFRSPVRNRRNNYANGSSMLLFLVGTYLSAYDIARFNRRAARIRDRFENKIMPTAFSLSLIVRSDGEMIPNDDNAKKKKINNDPMIVDNIVHQFYLERCRIVRGRSGSHTPQKLFTIIICIVE